MRRPRALTSAFFDPDLPAHLGSAVLGPDRAAWSSGSGHYASCTLRRLDGGPLTGDSAP
ncbi:hypothetical protein [Streptomyces sp. Y1]|uniref:Uncharacterized protein n=1 Tax=Streptomyces sp. Y1 TaxID=3238634 RepID=A0AB39TVE4_9ACTN